MSTKLNYDEYVKKYGEATGVVIKDSQGNRTTLKSSEAKRLGLSSDPSVYNKTTVYKGSDGKYTSSPADVAGISMNTTTGKINISIPEQYKDDDYVTSYTNTTFLKQLSQNYKADKEAKYQDPFEEGKQVTAEEYVNKLNEALKERISALDALPDAQNELMALYGDDEKKQNIIMGLSANDVVTMSAVGQEDDSYLAIPEWMTTAYPAITKLGSYSNGYVKASDFRDNFFNTTNGSITESQAKAIKDTAEKMLVEGESYSSDPEQEPTEFAKNVAFQTYISGTEPILSGWSKHAHALEAAVSGGAVGFAQSAKATLDNLSYLVTLGQAKDATELFGEYNPETGTMETPEFWTKMGLTEEAFKEKYEYFSDIDSNAAGLMGFSYGAGGTVETMAEVLLTQGLIDTAVAKGTTAILAKGAETTAAEMANVAGKAASTETKLETAAETVAANQAAGAKLASAVNKAQKLQKFSTTANFFNMTVDEASSLFTTMYGGTRLALSTASAGQAANIINTAVKATKMATATQSALSILGNMAIVAAVSDKETLHKILTSEATESETKSYLTQVAFDFVKMEAFGLATGAAINKIAGTKFGKAVGEKYSVFKEKASQTTVKFTSKISEPYIKFRDWFISKKMAKKNVSNATLNANEAIKEAKYRQEGRKYGTTLETQEFATTGVNPVTGQMSEYKTWQADAVAAENMLTSWGSVQDSEYQILSQLSNPEIEPHISQLMSEANHTDTKLLQLEEAENKLTKADIKTNKSLGKNTYNLAFSGHSKEVALYANRSFDMLHANDRIKTGDLSKTSEEYIEIKDNYERARAGVSDKIANVIDTEYLPSLMRLENAILTRMTRDWGVFPESYVNSLRASGKWGKDGEHYLRRVARKDMPKGTYTPFSHAVERKNTIDLNSDKVMEDDDITWIGLGLHELVQEAAIAKASKKFVEVSERYQGLAPEVLMSENKTAAAGRVKEFKGDIKSSTNNAMKMVSEDISESEVVRNKRDAEIAKFNKQKEAELGGINTMDVDTLRSTMSDNNIMVTPDIVDENTFLTFKESSTKQVQKILDEKFVPVMTEAEYTFQDEINELQKDLDLFNKLSKQTSQDNAALAKMGRPDAMTSNFDSPTIRNLYDKYKVKSTLPSVFREKLQSRIDKLKKADFTETGELIQDIDRDAGGRQYFGREEILSGVKRNSGPGGEYWRAAGKKSDKNLKMHFYAYGDDAKDAANTYYEQTDILTGEHFYNEPTMTDFSDKVILDATSVDGAGVLYDILSNSDRESLRKAADEFYQMPTGGYADRIEIEPKALKPAKNAVQFYNDLSDELAKYGVDGIELDTNGFEEAIVSDNKKPAAKINVKKTPTYTRNIDVRVGPEQYLPTQYELYQKYSETNPKEFDALNAQLDRINAASNEKIRKSEEVQQAAKTYTNLTNALFADNIYQAETLEYELKATKKEKGSTESPLKYELDSEKIDSELEDGIEDMLGVVLTDNRAVLAIDGAIELSGNPVSDARRKFVILSEFLSKDNAKNAEKAIRAFAKKIVDGSIPHGTPVIPDNIKSLYRKVSERATDKFESALARYKNTLESYGETVESETIVELLEKYQKDMLGYDEDPTVIKAIGEGGEIVVKRVTPSVADLYKNRPVYSPMSTPMQILADMALAKRISLTNISLRSFIKQAVTDPLQSFIAVGAIPGTFGAMSSEISSAFGEQIAEQIRALEPYRWQNIVDLADAEGISIGEAAVRNIEATSETQLPFTTMSREALSQADTMKYGFKEGEKGKSLNAAQKVNQKLQKISKTLGKPNDIRETYNRKVAGQKAFEKALKQGYNYKQAEEFRQHAVDNATTNFRQKHTMFNFLRVTTPYLTAGISGAKSFWKMFELDPAGVTGRIFTGFVCPIIWFIGEIMEDDDLKEKYKNISEDTKANHLPILVNGEIVLIPIGEELGLIVDPIRHLVEELSDTNKYQFWTLMMNDIVGLSPVDLTGFTDPDMWEDITGQPPSFLEVMENGVSKILAQTMPPLLQSGYMAATERDLYTGNKIDTGYVTIDDDGNATIMSYSNSQFAKAVASIIGGDARVVEKVTSGSIGTTFLNVLDTITSAVQYVGTGGQEGSLTTAIDKAVSDISKPFATNDYASLDNQFKYAVRDLWNMKEEITASEEYTAYNKKIAQTADSTERQKLINKRNELMVNFFDRIEGLVNNYRNKGGSLDKTKFSNIVSLMTFEDALRADKTYAGLNTTYSDAYKQAMNTLYNMGIHNPDGISMIGYIYTDSDGNTQVKTWTPTQAQLISNAYSYAYGGGQGSIHTTAIKAIIDDGTSNSLKKQKSAEYEAEQTYWDKYNSTGELSDSEWDKIDELRKEYNEKVVEALTDYMDTYGAENVLNNDEVIDLLSDYIKVPSSYEKVKGRYVSSGGGKLDKQAGFAESYIKKIFGVE